MSRSEEHRNRSGEHSGEKKSSNAESEENRYRPVVENLILFLLNRSRWFRTVREFVESELKVRGGRALKGIIFLSMGIGLILLSLALLLVLLIIALDMLIGNLLYATAAVFAFSLVSAIILLILTFRSFAKALDMSDLEEKPHRRYRHKRLR